MRLVILRYALLGIVLVTGTGCPSFHRRSGIVEQAMAKD